MNPRVPPQNLEAEQSILSGLMLDAKAWDQIQDIVTADDFYKSSHRKLFSVIAELYSKGEEVDLITVSHKLNTNGELEMIGGSSFLADLIQNSLGAVNLVKYAEIVKDQSLLRKLISVNTDLIDKAYAHEFSDVAAHLDFAESQILAVAGNKLGAGIQRTDLLVKAALEKIEYLYHRKADVTGVASGFAELDKMTAGFQPGELTIIAARPSMGKTAFSLNIAAHAAIREKKKVAYFSIEMVKEQIMMRLLGSEARVPLSDIRTGKIDDSAWPRLIQTASVVSEAPLYIDDSTATSPLDIRAKCRRLQSQSGLDLIIIDYLQLLMSKKQVESREREVSEFSSTLKRIAKELNVAVIALAQLNRGVEGRSDRRPLLSDLRESGSIEQDADVIMMIYRDEYYEKDKSESKGQAEIIVGKQRNGPTGTANLGFMSKYGLFSNLSAADYSTNPGPAPQSQFQGNRSASSSGEKPRNFAVRKPDYGPTT